MTDSERLDFLESTGADTGKRDDLHFCLAWGEQQGVTYVVASGHALTLRDAVEHAAVRYARYLSEAKRSGAERHDSRPA